MLLAEYHILNSEELVKSLNEFKANVCLLQDLKDSLIAAEYELMLLQKKFPNKVSKNCLFFLFL